MEMTINSRKLGKQVTFSRPGGSSLYTDLGQRHKEGTLGYQLCDGGYVLSGGTLSYSGDDYAAFKHICRRWWAAHLKVYGGDYEMEKKEEAYREQRDREVAELARRREAGEVIESDLSEYDSYSRPAEREQKRPSPPPGWGWLFVKE